MKGLQRQRREGAVRNARNAPMARNAAETMSATVVFPASCHVCFGAGISFPLIFTFVNRKFFAFLTSVGVLACLRQDYGEDQVKIGVDVKVIKC